MLKVNNKNTRTNDVLVFLIVNFEHISIVEFEQVNVSWVRIESLKFRILSYCGLIYQKEISMKKCTLIHD